MDHDNGEAASAFQRKVGEIHVEGGKGELPERLPKQNGKYFKVRNQKKNASTKRDPETELLQETRCENCSTQLGTQHVSNPGLRHQGVLL